MKFIFQILVVLWIFPFNQADAQFAIGGGVAFTTNTNDVGVQIKSQFSIGKRWRAEASLDGYSTGSNQTYYGDFNLNANFIYADAGNVELHALLGGVVFFGSTNTLGFVESGTIASGINFGTGLQYELNDNLNGFLDGIFTFTDFGRPELANRFLFSLGVIYEFNNQSN